MAQRGRKMTEPASHAFLSVPVPRTHLRITTTARTAQVGGIVGIGKRETGAPSTILVSGLSGHRHRHGQRRHGDKWRCFSKGDTRSGSRLLPRDMAGGRTGWMDAAGSLHAPARPFYITASPPPQNGCAIVVVTQNGACVGRCGERNRFQIQKRVGCVIGRLYLAKPYSAKPYSAKPYSAKPTSGIC